jgi:hypothetical protein
MGLKGFYMLRYMTELVRPKQMVLMSLFIGDYFSIPYSSKGPYTML